MPTQVKVPSECPQELLAAFESLASAAGKVTTDGLATRISEAKALVCHFEDGKLVAIAALKNPRQSYRAKLRNRSGFDLDEGRYPYEIGWVFVSDDYQGNHLSRPLVEACLESAGSAGVFATTSEKNERMQRTLKRFSFVQVGQAYKSDRNDDLLVLFVREKSPPV